MSPARQRSYAHVVTAESPTADRRPARVRAELVGRDDVLALAERRWAEAAAGDGQFLLVAGEAGIGKSRMLDEIASRLPDVATLTTRAWPKDTEFPGAVLFDLARALRQSGRGEPADALATRVRADDTSGDAARRYRILVADLADLVLEVLTGEATLLRIEDLHWADELSLDVLERVAPLVRRAPALVVATYRSDEVRPGSSLAVWRSHLLAQRFAEEAPLAPLDADGTARLAESLLGEVPSAALLEDLLTRSNGIPLYVEELIAAGDAHLVPDTIAEAVRQRASGLPAEVQTVAEAAAVIGCSFEFPLLLDILGGRGDDELEERLRNLCDEHLLERLSATKYDYRHALLRDALYEEIPVTRRRRLHEAVAAASERAGLRASYLSEQYELAGLPERAFPHAVRAADAAAGISAHREAADLYSRALRTAPADVDPAELARLTACSAAELAAIDDSSAAATRFEDAIRRLREVGDVDRAAALVAPLMAMRHLLGDDLAQRIGLAAEARGWLEATPGGGGDAAWGRLLGAEAAAYMLARRLDASIDIGQQALTRLERDADPAARLDVQATLGAVQVFAGRTEGWELLEGVIREAGTEHEAAAVRARRMIATSASVLVEYGIATRWLDEGLEFTAAAERWNDHHYLRAHRG
ncbi:AAA family ATPase, partial [Schumannella luteola]